MGLGKWLEKRSAENARRERQEYLDTSYVKFVKCENCGKRTRVRVPKGSSVSEWASTATCENCQLQGTFQ